MDGVNAFWKWATSRETIFALVCGIAAAYFAYASLQPFFPAPDVTKDGRYIFLLIGIMFLLAPFARKVEIAKVFSFESRLAEVKAKAESAEIKAETAQTEIRHLQVVQATLTNSLSSVNSNANANSVYLQFYNESKEAALRGLGGSGIGVSAASNSPVTDDPGPDCGQPSEPNAPSASSNDATLATVQQVERLEGDSALAKLLILRREIEVVLRSALGKSLDIHRTRKDAKFLSSRQLFNMLLIDKPSSSRLAPSFDFFINTGNAAAHGQVIPENVLNDALHVGVELLRQIRNLAAEISE
ncbi:hypothetical protein ASF29_23350 [Rhizobium sp. Leaf262]|nr:hypothetical protein ASF29_23350 [Rhizobium sp. Leaf262]